MPEGTTPNSTILLALDQVINAINNLSGKVDELCQCIPEGMSQVGGGECGCGNGGGTGSPVDSEPVDGQTPVVPGNPPGPGGGGLPPNWDGDTASYNAYKCKAANYAYEACYNALVYLAGLATVAGTIGAGVAVGNWLLSLMVAGGAAYTAAGGIIIFAFVPAWVIGAIVAAIAVVAALAGWAVLSVAGNVADEFSLDQEQIVCDLYNAQTPEEARDVLGTALGDAVANMIIEPPYNAFEAQVRAAYAAVCGYFVTNALVNMLFEENVRINMYSGGSIDCSVCEEEIGDYIVDIGNETSSHPSNPIILSGVFVSGFGCGANARAIQVRFGSNVRINNFVAYTGLGECAGADVYYYYSDLDLTDLILSNSVSPGSIPFGDRPTNVRGFYILNNGEFSGEIHYEVM